MKMESISDLIRKVSEGNETILEIFDLEDGKSDGRIEIASRKLNPEMPEYIPEPPIARALARNHVFHDVTAFADYLITVGEKHSTLILADVNARKVVALLKDVHAGTDREVITLEAIEHPLFTPWARLMDRNVPVLDFALHCMKNRRAIIEPDGRELALTFSQVKMSKAVTVNSGVGAKSLNGVMVSVEIQGTRKDQLVELPESITVNLPLFVGTEPQNIVIDLLVTNAGESVFVNAVAPDVEAQRIAAFEQYAGIIRDKTEMLVGLGVIKQRDWEVADKTTANIRS